MKIDIDSKTAKRDFSEMLEGIEIHGEARCNGRKVKVKSVIGKKCANQLAKGMWGYLTAFKVAARSPEVA